METKPQEELKLLQRMLHWAPDSSQGLDFSLVFPAPAVVLSKPEHSRTSLLLGSPSEGMECPGIPGIPSPQSKGLFPLVFSFPGCS